MSAISSDNDALQADFALNGSLNQFQGIHSASNSLVSIHFDAQLVRTRDKKIIASQLFQVEQPINSKGIAPVIQAFGHASDQLTTQLVNWTLQQLAQLPAE